MYPNTHLTLCVFLHNPFSYRQLCLCPSPQHSSVSLEIIWFFLCRCAPSTPIKCITIWSVRRFLITFSLTLSFLSLSLSILRFLILIYRSFFSSLARNSNTHTEIRTKRIMAWVMKYKQPNQMGRKSGIFAAHVVIERERARRNSPPDILIINIIVGCFICSLSTFSLEMRIHLVCFNVAAVAAALEQLFLFNIQTLSLREITEREWVCVILFLVITKYNCVAGTVSYATV